jgi:hypothetical protein
MIKCPEILILQEKQKKLSFPKSEWIIGIRDVLESSQTVIVVTASVK